MAYLPDGHQGRPGPCPPRPRPPLTKRMRRGHWVALDCVAGAIAAVGTAIPALNDVRPSPGPFPEPPPLHPWPFPGRITLNLLFLAAVFVPVGFRRLRPVPAFGALILLAVGLYALNREAHGALALLACSAYALYTVTAETSRRTGAAALGLALVVDLTVFLGGFFTPDRLLDGNAVPVAFVLVICWITGHSVRQRRVYADTLREQAASSAVAGERLRIARELHDVVAHSMSVIAVQAGFGQYVIDSSPADARDALGAIQATSRDALEEMRRMLGVLRQQDIASPPPAAASGSAPLAPAPGLAGLDRLIERTSGTGVRVSLERLGPVTDVPAGVDLSAYRIVQEALTNVVKHVGAAACCAVRVRYHQEALIVEVTDDGGHRAFPGQPAPVSGGHGIIGMRERAALCGGSLEAGPEPGGGFRVTATLPLHPAPVLGGAVSGGAA